jgi:glucokinase
MILAGDIGGTSTRLAFFEVSDGRPTPVAEQVFSSREHSGLDEIVMKFLAGHAHSVTCAAFGVAGPVRGGISETPNLPWIVNSKTLGKYMGLDNVGLINDLEANAWGVDALGPGDFAVLNEGAVDAAGNAAIISAGTGLGEAGMYWDGTRHRPIASEGGHCDFAARNELEVDLLRFLLAEFGRVSFERVISGPGLFNIYRFMRDTGRGEEPAWLAKEISGDHPSAAISKAALSGKSELAVKALDLFVSIYGAEAGNVALKFMAVGGLYVGGGIAPKIIEKVKGPHFMEAFLAKGRLRPVLEAIPVRVILNDKTALLGAARYASVHCSR